MLFTRVDIFLELKCQENRPLRMTVIKRRLNCEINFSETQHKFGIVPFILKLVLLLKFTVFKRGDKFGELQCNSEKQKVKLFWAKE